MNLRKIFLCLHGGLLAVLAFGSLLFPFKNGFAASDDKQAADQPSTRRQDPPNFDALALSPDRSSDLQNTPKIEGGHLTQTEPRFDVPTFLWASDPGRAQSHGGDSFQRANNEEAAA